MSFLQPAILFALPLVALPILIHLLNRNRHRTIPWAATMFLLQAKRMARGMARLRYLLLMLARMLAIAGLIMAISRPMADGWLGLTASSTPETTVIVLDRSVSMEEQNPQTGRSKRSTALRKFTDLIHSTEANTKIVLFDSALQLPLEVSSVSELAELPEAGATATSSDIPALMQQVAEYLDTNESGRTDVWVCSDLRRNDWNPTSGRWESVRRQLEAREGLRLFLLSYPDITPNNFAVSVSGVHRRQTMDGAELVMDIGVTRSDDSSEPQTIDLTVVIDGARSRLSMEIQGSEVTKNGHTIPIAPEAREGWGRVELPRDSNPSDNSYCFVYAEPAIRRTVIVSDNAAAAEMFRIATRTPVDHSLIYEAEVLPAAAANTLPWDETALIIWQAPIPDGLQARQLEDFVASGRCVMFFPPANSQGNTLFGGRWSDWRVPESGDRFGLKPWRTDSDLLANTQNGTPLPAGQVECYRACSVEVAKATSLWQLDSGIPLLTRASTDQGAAWFCSTLPTPANSNLASNGVTFYIMLQRALARGAAALGKARQIEAGTVAATNADSWKPLDELSGDTWVSQRAISTGLYQSGDRRLALNRPLVEDVVIVMDDVTLDQMLSGLEYTRIDDKVGGSMQLASEIWRTFLFFMIFALLAEALLCVPERTVKSSTVDVASA